MVTINLGFWMELVCQTQELNRLERLSFLIFSY